MKLKPVNFENAKLLKEKGFDWKAYSYYHEDGNRANGNANNWSHFTIGKFYSAPTQALVCKWLREVHGIDISIIAKWLGKVRYVVSITYPPAAMQADTVGDFDTYEQAEEAAIEYCLKNSI